MLWIGDPGAGPDQHRQDQNPNHSLLILRMTSEIEPHAKTEESSHDPAQRFHISEARGPAAIFAPMADIPAFPTDLVELRAFLEAAGSDRLPGLLGIELVELAKGSCVMRLEVQRKHEASNGFLHAGTVVTLADTAAGYGTVASLPPGAYGFTTIELKSNHIRTLNAGGLIARASMVHGGRTTQVWDAVVTAEATGKTVAMFRNTQLMLYP